MSYFATGWDAMRLTASPIRPGVAHNNTTVASGPPPSWLLTATMSSSRHGDSNPLWVAPKYTPEWFQVYEAALDQARADSFVRVK